MAYQGHDGEQTLAWNTHLQKVLMQTFTDEYVDWSLSPFALFKGLNDIFREKNVQYVADVGNNQMWAAHTLRLNQGQMAHYSGGLGTRLSEETSLRPKPMVEIGGRPILWHVMKIYSAHGINDFIICCGYTLSPPTV